MAVSWCLVAVLAAFVTIAVAQSSNYAQYGRIFTQPGKSCRDIYQLNTTSHGTSAYYIIEIGDRPSFVYCDMELECGGEKGWMRVTSVDATNDYCPLRLLVLLQLVELLVIMLDVILLNSQLTKLLTVEYVEWFWAIRKVLLMDLPIITMKQDLSMVHMSMEFP